MDKFEQAQNKQEIKQALIHSKLPYKNEYDEFLNSTFILTPLPFFHSLTDDDYNIDRNILTLKFEIRPVIDFDDGYGNCNFYGAEIERDLLKGVKHSPFLYEIDIDFPLEKAAQIFRNNERIKYTVYHYVKPINKIFRYTRLAMQGFEIEGIQFVFTNEKEEELMTILLHDYEDDGWTIKIFHNSKL